MATRTTATTITIDWYNYTRNIFQEDVPGFSFPGQERYTFACILPKSASQQLF